MKLKKHIFTILLVVLLFLLIGSVSATDINTNDTQTVSASGNDEILSVGNDVDILGEGEYNYTQLKDQFRFDGDITLTAGNYTYVSGDGDTIKITTSRVIDGNGAVIDMANSGHRAFSVTTDGVTIKNLTIKNANFNGNGGAIYFSSSGTVENCNFTNNHAEYDGGAIRMSSGSVTNCNFTGNKATGSNSWGGAILFAGKGSVTNCNFINNTATNGNGGAIYFYYGSTGTVTNCNFTNNSARYGGAIYFEYGSTGNVTNCNFSGNTADGDGGAVYFNNYGNVTNCNFTNNKATGSNSWGGAVYMYFGSVTNCNFTDNEAYYGGAIRFDGEGNVTNCNFSDNTATNGNGGAIEMFSGSVENCNFTANTATRYGGAVYFQNTGTVSNCNFTANQASRGGAVYFLDGGKVENCNFTGNNATTGSAIYFYKYYSTDTLTISNSTFLNNRANAEALEVTKNENNITITFTGNDNLLNAICSRNDAEVTFTNVTYWSAKGINNTGNSAIKPSRSNKEAGQNITVSVVVNDKIVLSGVYLTNENGTLVLPIIAGSNYYISASHKTDSYYTEAEKTNSTMKFNVNVTSQTSNNKTVNITAKSNIPNEVIDGKLLFILPNGTEINASYASNGTWWALHTFDGAGDYNINATFIGLDNVTINNATICIRYDASVDVNNNTLNLLVGDNFTIVATTVPEGVNVTFVQDDSGVYIVDENGVVTALKNGTGSVLVKVGGDGIYAKNSTIVNVTVSKVPTEITVLNDTLVLEVSDEIAAGATLTPPDAGNLTYSISNSSVVKVEDGKIIALAEGEAVITVSFEGDKKYLEAENKTINVTVNKIPTEITVDSDSLDLFVGDETVIAASLNPSNAGNVSFTSSDDSVVIVDEKGNVIANGKGQAIITVSFAGDNKYAESENKTITLDVSLNDASVTVDNDTLDLKVDERYQINATRHPDTILLDITYKSSDNSVASVDENGVVTALGEGTAIITLSVGDGEIYAENSTNVTVTVKKVNPAMNISCDEITEGENATITVTLPSDATGNVSTTVNGKTYFSEVKDGKAVITVPDLLKGDYTLPITYSGDDKYNPLTKDLNITVEGGKAIISAPDLVKYYSGSERFTVNLTYAKGSPAANKSVNITINGVTYPRTTDENGMASLNINLGAGKYDVSVKTDDGTADSVVTVLSTINASDVESKSKNLVFTAVFIDGTGNPLTDGSEVTFNVKGVIYNSTVKGGKGSASIDLTLDSGRYIITSFNPVSGENASNNIAVDLKDADMILSGDEITVGENATISVTLPSDATGNVTASVNGKSYSSKVNGGKANIIIPALAAGNYTASVTYSGDDKYNSAAGETNVTVNKANAAMTIDAPAITAGENATITVTLPSDATGSVSIGNESVPVKDGNASAVLTDLPVGTNTIPVTYSGDDKYNTIETSADIIVNEKPVPAKENLTIKATADEITEGENATVIITGLENATGNVSASVNGKAYAAPINDGQATITVPGLAENATAAINYPGDDKYNPAVTTVNITVNRNTVTINAENLTKYYKDPQKFTVTVTDAKGQVAPNKTVDITINGVTYKRTSDENGTASLNINLGAGEYPVSVAVDDVVVNSTVIVMSTIDASDVVKMFRNDTQYYAIFSDANGNILANTNVSFNINGVIYNRTTDGNGTAKMNINMAAGDYIITATNPVTGEMKSNSIKVISLIESDDLTKYYRNASQFTVRIHSADGGYVGAGEEVTFNINGVFYTRTTNATGHAKLNINLGQGNYTITTYHKDCSQGNQITVLPILSADDLVMKYRDGSQFKAKLVDGQGKAYAGQTVQFNINGVLYNRITGSDGTAKLNINLMSGEYIITSSYNDSNIANKITIRG